VLVIYLEHLKVSKVGKLKNNTGIQNQIFYLGQITSLVTLMSLEYFYEYF